MRLFKLFLNNSEKFIDLFWFRYILWSYQYIYYYDEYAFSKDSLESLIKELEVDTIKRFTKMKHLLRGYNFILSKSIVFCFNKFINNFKLINNSLIAFSYKGYFVNFSFISHLFELNEHLVTNYLYILNFCYNSTFFNELWEGLYNVNGAIYMLESMKTIKKIEK